METSSCQWPLTVGSVAPTELSSADQADLEGRHGNIIRRIVFGVVGVVVWFCALQIHGLFVNLSRPNPAPIGIAPFPVSQFTPMDQKHTAVVEGYTGDAPAWIYNWSFTGSAEPKQVADYYDVVYPKSRHQSGGGGDSDSDDKTTGYEFDVTPARGGRRSYSHHGDVAFAGIPVAAGALC